MADYVTKIRTASGDKQIDYNALANKPTIPATSGAVSSILSSNLTASRVLVSNSSGKVAASSKITTTELDYLDGVTSYVQTQLNSKATVAFYEAKITTTGWKQDGSYYYLDITVSGILATDKPVVSVLTGDDNSKNVNYKKGFAHVFRIKTSANSIRVWTDVKPSVEIPIQMQVVR